MSKSSQYIKDLEVIAKVITYPFKDLPFSSVIRLLSGCKVLSFNPKEPKNKTILRKIATAAKKAGLSANKSGIFTNRPNEAGNKIEPFVKEALNEVGLKANIPTTKNGRKKSVGYPDIEIHYNNQVIYLECKTYNINNINTTQRAFYLSPSSNFKVTKDAAHLMLSYQLQETRKRTKRAYMPVYYKLFTLEYLTVDLKHEFNQNNRKMYGKKSNPNALLFEDRIYNFK